MARLYTYPNEDVLQWEPEPLYLPIDETPLDELYERGNRTPPGKREGNDDKVTGSHVIVIDLW